MPRRRYIALALTDNSVLWAVVPAVPLVIWCLVRGVRNNRPELIEEAEPVTDDD